MTTLKTKLEALLFASSQPLDIEKLAKLSREKDINAIKHALMELESELTSKESSIMLVEDNGTYRLTVRQKYISYVKKVVKQTELPKSLTETLAIIAYKAPVKQSLVIKIRHNKGYKHLDDLEKKGFITREKHGRTKLIKLTQKFFEYFDLTPEQLKKKFETAAQLEHQIEETEEEKEVQPEVYEKEPSDQVEVVKEKIGELEVYKKPIEEPEPKAEQTHETKDLQEEIKEASEKKKSRKGKGLFKEGVPPEIEKRIDERVQEIVEGEKEEPEKE